MASYIENGESIYIPFRGGRSIGDSQLKPRMYKSPEAFQKKFPGHYLGTIGVDLVEYAPVVRCGNCRFCDTADCPMSGSPGRVSASDFCSYGEKRCGNG